MSALELIAADGSVATMTQDVIGSPSSSKLDNFKAKAEDLAGLAVALLDDRGGSRTRGFAVRAGVRVQYGAGGSGAIWHVANGMLIVFCAASGRAGLASS